MHIVMLSDAETGGGAAIAASRSAAALVEAGVRVTWLVRVPGGNAHGWETRAFGSVPQERTAQKIIRKITHPVKHTDGRIPAVAGVLRKHLAELKPDIINVHNLHFDQGQGWTPDLVRVCCESAPTVWTLHDMWSFTGRCAYTYNCRKYLTGCDHTCPTPMEYPPLAPDHIAEAWQARRQLFADWPQLTAITPSQWLNNEAKAGLWANHRVETIPYGIPLQTYLPIDPQVARQALGIADHGPVLLMSGNKIDPLSSGAIASLDYPQATLLILGRTRYLDFGPKIHCHPLGWVDHERMKVLAYSAADMFLHHGQDNLPLVVMEALACGTPVVASPLGGTPEMVRDGISGWMSRGVEQEAFRQRIDQALRDLQQQPSLRPSCRHLMETEYSYPLCAQRYLTLFETVRQTWS